MGHIVDTVFDALALASDAGSCLGDSDALSCYMLPLDAVFLAVPFATKGGASPRFLYQADEVGVGGGARAARVGDIPLKRGDMAISSLPDDLITTSNGYETFTGRVEWVDIERIVVSNGCKST